ncbi:MAG TPA: hypothetical protein PK006_06100 [Saprospiraceae bacterium]|nr:hypothetical protein [Saprospiraceae bacterium]
MKLKWLIFLLAGFLLIVGLSACLNDECIATETFYQYKPIYKTAQQIRSEFARLDPISVSETGKIIVYKNYLLVNDRGKGIHIFDNSNPSNPNPISFINIPGNFDMAVNNDILYAEDYLDLLSIDISSISEAKLICRSENIFKSIYRWVDPIRGILVDYEKTKLTRTIDCRHPNFGFETWEEGDLIFSKNSGLGSSSGANQSTQGSQSRFGLIDQYLYVVDPNSLYSYDISNVCPVLTDQKQISWNLESIFTLNKKIFLGSQSGITIFSTDNPAKPNYVGELQHFRTCDPVVVEQSTAYVSLHGGTACGGYTNQLDIVDISTLSAPKLIRSYPMNSPKGLSIHRDILYLCDDGIKIINTKNKESIKLMAHYPIKDSYDVIFLDEQELLIVTAADGINQYKVSNQSTLSLLSSIKSVH